MTYIEEIENSPQKKIMDELEKETKRAFELDKLLEENTPKLRALFVQLLNETLKRSSSTQIDETIERIDKLVIIIGEAVGEIMQRRYFKLIRTDDFEEYCQTFGLSAEQAVQFRHAANALKNGGQRPLFIFEE